MLGKGVTGRGMKKSYKIYEREKKRGKHWGKVGGRGVAPNPYGRVK